jgi:hypothetical protein
MTIPSVLPNRNDDIPSGLSGIIKRLETKHYPMAGFRNCTNERMLDRYQGAQDVIDLLRVWEKVLAEEK